jgi:hypothetical protein
MRSDGLHLYSVEQQKIRGGGGDQFNILVTCLFCFLFLIIEISGGHQPQDLTTSCFFAQYLKESDMKAQSLRSNYYCL